MDKKTEAKNKPLPKEDIPAILRVCGEERDPNLQDVPHRDIPKYLRERYWIKQWSPSDRWPRRDFISVGGGTELRLADLERKLDDPGDAFFKLFLFTSRSIVHLRTWVEVTEVFLPEHALKVNRFVREYNGLRGKGKIDATEFLKSLNLGPPDALLQREMADQVIYAIKKKAQKGREGGSYRSLVRDYGRGVLIIGLPMWFATFPSDPADPSTALTDFFTRLDLGFENMKRSVLRANWCPFDSVVVLWNPTLESIDSWAKVTDPHFYSDPANLSWRSPVSWWKLQSFFRTRDFPIPACIKHDIRWDRYSSLDSMLTDQRRRLRFFNGPRPLGPKACLEVFTSERAGRALRMRCYTWLLQRWLFVRINGWHGLRRKIFARFSVPRLYSRWCLSCRRRKLYRSSFADRSKDCR